jgi:PKD repeat protein
VCIYLYSTLSYAKVVTIIYIVKKGGTTMDRRLFLPVVIMFLSVLLLGGLISYQAGSAQESPEENPAPVIGEKETVVQDSPKASAQEPEEKTNTSIKEAPASTPTFMGMGGGGAPKAASTETGNPVKKVEKVVVADFDYTVDGLNVTFNDTSQNASSWYWDFGDGNDSEEKNPIHEYANAEEYEVILIAYESAENELNNASRTQTIDLTVDDDEEEAGDPEENPESNPEDEPETNPPVTQEVPEFPTIAIPMAAIIGMAFIFSRRQ